MIHKTAIANDWNKIGNDMRVAFGLSVRQLDADALRGISAVLSVFKDTRVNRR